MNPGEWYHERFIHKRRVEVLANHFAEVIGANAEVLDVGCGDGKLAALISERRPDVNVRGIDVLVRDSSAIPVAEFDGRDIPLETDSVDTVIMVDVLHHTEAQAELLGSAARVARQQVILKDHYLQGFAAFKTLSVMDWMGNSRHGVDIPCKYLAPEKWDELFHAAKLRPVECREHLGLYPPPFNWLFERSLHFVVTLEPQTQ